MQPIYTKNIDNILEWNRHGVKLVFIQDGLLGKFDFSVLLLTFVSGIGLLAIVAVMVDMLAVYLIPQKGVYYKVYYIFLIKTVMEGGEDFTIEDWSSCSSYMNLKNNSFSLIESPF